MGPRAERAVGGGCGCRAVGGHWALAVMQRPLQVASCLILALLPWLQPGSWHLLPRGLMLHLAYYQDMWRLVQDLLSPEVCYFPNPAAIYANNEISLLDVKLYGLDYNYTGPVHSHSAPQDITVPPVTS